MGVGKSTVGPLVAAGLGLPFLDLDDAVAESAGMSVSELFASEGEAGFRAREAAMVARVCMGPPSVLALGGGTLHAGDNLSRLRARFRVVVLTVEWPVLEERLRALSEEGRPLLGRGRSLYQARQAGYASAGTSIDVTRLSPAEAAERVLASLEEPCTPR